MQLYFIRHAQSQNNAMWLRTGTDEKRVEDPDLTETGARQAQSLAQFIAGRGAGAPAGTWDPRNDAGFGLTHIYTSLMLRAVRTGYAIAEALDLPLLALEDLHETGGIFLENADTGEKAGLPGRGRAFFEQHYPRLRLDAAMNPNGWWNRPFELDELIQPRVERVIAGLLAQHGGSNDRVALVSHGGFFNYFTRALLKLPAGERIWFVTANAAIHRFDICDEVAVVYLNRVDFLPAGLVT